MLLYLMCVWGNEPTFPGPRLLPVDAVICSLTTEANRARERRGIAATDCLGCFARRRVSGYCLFNGGVKMLNPINL